MGTALALQEIMKKSAILLAFLLPMAACRAVESTPDTDPALEFDSPFAEVWDASLQNAEAAGLRILNLRLGSSDGAITARLAGGSVVQLLVESLSPEKVRVKVESDREDPEIDRFRRSIEDELPQYLGDEADARSIEGSYAKETSACQAYARLVLQVLSARRIDEQGGVGWHILEGYWPDGVRVRLTLNRESEFRTRIIFGSRGPAGSGAKEKAAEAKRVFEQILSEADTPK